MVSKGLGERAGDKFITEQSVFLKMLPHGKTVTADHKYNNPETVRWNWGLFKNIRVN